LDRIRAWPKPNSRDELRAYLGLFLFLSMFSLHLLTPFVHCKISLKRRGVCRIGFPNMMSVLKHQSYSAIDKSQFTSTTRLPLKITLMAMLMNLGEFLFRMTNKFGDYLHRWRNLGMYGVLLPESFWL